MLNRPITTPKIDRELSNFRPVPPRTGAMILTRSFALALLMVLGFVLPACLNLRDDVEPDAAAVDRKGGSSGRGSLGEGGQGGAARDAPGGAGDPDGGTFTCVVDSICVVPGSPCVVGKTNCTDGVGTCVASERQQANGTVCGMGAVCLDGACKPCANGDACTLEGKACRAGTIECASGQAQCVESGKSPNGTACGAGMVCKDGACGTCSAGDPCVPSNPCHEGVLDCTGGVSTCMDTGRPASVGSACGAGKVCSSAGACVACEAGASCETSEPCMVGKIECSSGGPSCLPTGSAANGKACGAGKVCNDGACAECKADATCTPSNKCRVGTQSCSTGTPECKETGATVANGTLCGTNLYCSNGACLPCTPGAACSVQNACKIGKTSCRTGASVCEESGNAPNGKSCGNGMVCSDGACVPACKTGDLCPSGNPCKQGRTTCNGNTMGCGPGENINEQGACPTGVCRSGSCVRCGGVGQPCCAGRACGANICNGQGMCVARVCSPGSAPFCDSSQSKRCNSEGTGYTTTNCGSGCAPGTGSCCGTSEWLCNSSCIAKTQPCGQRCFNTAEYACGTRCISKSTCCTNGATGCGSTEDCKNGKCEPKCTPGGAGTCTGNSNKCKYGRTGCGATACENHPDSLPNGTVCSQDGSMHCMGGECVKRPTCTEGRRECVGEFSIRECRGGAWGSPMMCPKTALGVQQICSHLNTDAVCREPGPND